MPEEIMQDAAAPQEAAVETSSATNTEANLNQTPQTNNSQNSLLGNKNEANKTEKQVVEPDWREDWLDKMAGEDEKAKNILGRYASPKAVADALIAAQKKISSYKPQVELPENPSEEDISKYRKAYGIPETPDKYDLDGIVIGDEDKELLGKFLEKAHARNAKPSEVKAVVKDYFENLQEQNKAISQKFQEQQLQTEKELMAEWGSNYRQNFNIINNFLSNKFGEDTTKNLAGAVLADGTRLDSNPKLLRAFLQIAQDVDPVATLGGSAGQTAQSIEKEIEDIRHVMKTNPDAYFNDNRMSKRYSELIQIKSRLQ